MIWTLVIAGGSGTRLWPESRRSRPKQLLRIFGSKTLLEDTLSRLSSFIPRSRTLVLTQNEHVREVHKLTHLPLSQILGEPVGRNTAPCVAIAAAQIIKKDPEAILVILPADNRITKVAVFQKALKAAAEASSKSKMPVTLGILPSSPHTGYGYLEKDRLVSKKGGVSVCQLKGFHEKPTLAKAKAFLKTGRFFWNGGIFIWRADSLLEAVARYQPKMKRVVEKITAADFGSRMKRLYSQMPNISIDYGLMEKLGNRILMIPVDMGWSDLGGWQAVADHFRLDAKGNAVLRGNAVLLDSSGNIIRSEKRLIALASVQDMIVIDTQDALLVCPKHHSESIRHLVARLKEEKLEKYS